MGRKVLLACAVLALIALFLALDLRQYISLEFFRAQRQAIDVQVAAAPVRAALVFFAIYVAVTALSVPGAAVLTLVGGALFGLLWGTVIVSFAASVGATLAFLTSRFLLRDWVQAKLGQRLASINDGIRKDGLFYLLALRLAPVIPFFAINLAMGLTTMPARTFYWVSQLGMLPGTLLYVYAGTQLGRFEITWQLVLALTLLAIFPLIAKKVIDTARARRVYRRWARPRSFDRNLVVIGAGSAGLVSAYIAAAVKAKVTLIERHRMGGDCLHTGCVPSKALVRTARLVADMRRAADFGLPGPAIQLDFAAVMERVHRVIAQVEPHDSVRRYQSLGVECLSGTARIATPWSVEVRSPEGEKRTLTTRAIVIASGARPVIPAIPGLEEAGPLTSDTVWHLRKLPRRLVVLGGGPIGTELAQCFARFGSEVTQVEMAPRILSREDPEVSALVATRLRAEGVRVLTGHKATRVVVEGGEQQLVVEHEGREQPLVFDEILCAVGRRPTTDGLGLEELGIHLTSSRTVETDEYLQTIYPNIYACGDVAGPYQFTHTASHQAWYASVNALFGRFRRFRADYRVIPWATFTDPEVARVGLNEIEAREKNVAHEVTRFELADLDRAITDGATAGFVKVLTVPGRDRILGATIVGAHAGDLIIEFILAMRHGLGLEKVLSTIHIYPTFVEANKYSAGAWKRAHVSPRVLRLLERYHAWTRA